MGSFTGVGTPVMGTGGQPVVAETTLLTTLHDLFCAISSQPKTTGTVAPQAFINQLKRDNEFFRSTLHQDAHEFLNYLVNMIAEAVEKEEKVRLEKLGAHLQRELDPDHPKTWVHTLFEGILTNETRCLTCETVRFQRMFKQAQTCRLLIPLSPCQVTSRDEAFLDLSIDIEPNSSVTSCLRQFSANEMLCQRNKFSCDKCCGLQEAEKRMKIKKLPNILALHLKRFKYEESLQRHVKLTYRVVFPFELRLFNTADGVGNPDRLYELWAIVVHIGVGPHHGHYISIVKSGSRWIVFDDNSVFPIEEKDIQRYFGDTPGQGSGYVLFYQAVDLDVRSLSLRSEPRQRSETSSSISSTPLSSSYRPVALPEDIPPVPALPVELPPPQVSGLGLGLEPPEFAAPAPPPQSINGDPMSPPADAAHNLFNIPIPDQPDQFGPDQPLIPIPPTPLSSDTQTPLPATTPKSEKASLLSLSTNSNSASAPPKEKEGMWTLRGKKSVTSRIGRSLSLTANKEPARSVSSPTTGSASDFPSLPTIPSSASNGHLTNGGAPALFEPFTSTASQASGVAVPFTAEPETHAGLPTLPVSLSPHDASLNSTAHSTPTTSFPPPPSDDGSASTVSTGQGLHPGHSPQRRGSKASIDAGPSSNGPLATTRSLFSRKNSRPLSSSGSSGAGLGITSTTGRSGSLPNGTLDGLPPSSGPGLGDSQGATLHSSPSMILTKKEMEKKAKEERKEEERRAKERARIQKEDMKRAKEAEKIKKKLSLKM
ncbi:cysteine proteinase [Meredithblackwellia eburnea MCA 4105]